jgi:hypothetical protein
MSSKLVMGQRCTKAAVNFTMLGGSGCSSSGVKPIRPLPFFVVTIFTLVLVGRLASKAVSAASMLRRKFSTNTLAWRGCSRAA